MRIERIVSEGLSHYSYYLSAGGEAMVIDPRRDVDAYVGLAEEDQARIARILETHRNEDYVVGSLELASRTDSDIFHADVQFDYAYGMPVSEGDSWSVGSYRLEALATPGHTPGHVSYLLRDSSGEPLVLFSGDALFAGEIGRADLMGGDMIDESAAMLYETLQERILPLGDGVVVMPAHGGGSACGGAISDRPYTTVGIERRDNPKLRMERADFVRAVGREARAMEKPPYFDRMEHVNVHGTQILGSLPAPQALSPTEFGERSQASQLVDVRPIESFLTSHPPEALSVQLDVFGTYGGWFVNHRGPVLTVAPEGKLDEIVRRFVRMGYDEIAGYLSGGAHAWETAGLQLGSTGSLGVRELCSRLDAGEDVSILDVRSAGEVEALEIPGATHIHVTELPDRLDEVPEGDLVIFCGSGVRSTIAASVLEREGRAEGVSVVLGGTSAWTSVSCPLTPASA